MPTSSSVIHEAPLEPKRGSIPTHFNSATLPVEAMILPPRDRISMSLRPVDTKLVKMEHHKSTPKSHTKPLIKPVGWVSPNTWDSYREIEGDYVDLVDFAKGKEALDKLDSHPNPLTPVLFKPVRPAPPIPLGNSAPCGCNLRHAEEPCIPRNQRKQGNELTDEDLKCRYRDSYLAALRNPVTFEKGSVDMLAALDEVRLCEEGEFGSSDMVVAHGGVLGHSCNHCNDRMGKTNIAHQVTRDSKVHQIPAVPPSISKTFDGNIKPHQVVEVVKPSGKHKVKLRSLSSVSETAKGSPLLHKYSNRSHSDICPEMISNISNCFSSLPYPFLGSKDKTGRAVVEVHGDKKEWTSPLVSAQAICELLLYLHSIPRKEVRDLGMTLVIDARKKPPPLFLYKALLMAQMDIVTSLKALNKTVEGIQLTYDLGGTFTYNHTDWLQFHQRLVSFMTDLQGADNLLQKAIKKVDGGKKMDTLCIQEQRALMKEVLEDARLVTLQREGGAILARMRREEFRFPQSEDYRYALESVTGLYNQVEEKLHTLVMRSNESLQNLEFLFRLREMEGKISTVLSVLSASALAKECSHYLEQVEKGCYPAKASISTLKMYEERLGGEFSAPHFQTVKAKACAVGSGALGWMKVWNAAWVQCQKVRQRLEERLKKKSIDKNQNQQATAVAPQGKVGVLEKEEERSEVGEACCSLTQELPSPKQVISISEGAQEESRDSGARESTNVPCLNLHLKADLKGSEREEAKVLHVPETPVRDGKMTPDLSQNGDCHPETKWRPREHSSEADLRRVDSVSRDEEFPWHQALGRSLSDGSCVSSHPTSISGFSPLSARHNHCQGRTQPLDQSLKPIHNWPVSRIESFCSEHLNCEKLQRIMEELLLTEREYVRALGYVREHYFPELERADVPQDLRGQRGSIFGNLEKLHDFHRHHFLKELESCVKEPLRVGRCFLRHRESFALYALYSKNKPQSDSLLINHGQAFFKQKQLKLGDKMDLWSYLLKPVQRISKYSLLLQDMMRECGLGQTREMAEVQAALEVIHFQLRHGNNLLAMDDIHNCDVNLKEQGQLIRQDEFLVTFRKKKCFRHIFLFQELILFSKTRRTSVGNDTYIYKQSFKFETGILDACLRILDMNPKYLRNPGKDCSGRRNPIYVCRVLSAMVNCNDDQGVLLGKWTDDYEGGVSPMSWKGSVEILQNWDRNACQPVRYGQCWVFAAVACSVSRALGIPCRVVTNYLSAHDTNANLVIERYINEDGQPIRSRDMIWNYHCWVESWMTRPDLKSGFDGWQASDPTPQEKSEGVYCCGPIPVKAIKEGELMIKYDAPFVFAEVNADVVTFMQKKDGNTEKVTAATLVGQKISTKNVGNDKREDITHLYKYPEGSAEEREAFKKANHQNKLLQQQENQGLHLTIKVTSEMRKGCDFDVYAVVTNNTPSEKKCRLVFGSTSVSYNGVLGENCGFKDLLNVELQPGGERRVPLRLNYSKYGGALTEDNLIRLAALLIDYTTRDITLAVRNIVLENPEIKVRILGEPKENRKLAAELTLQNPLPEPLESCCFSIEGANLTGGRVLTERLDSVVGPGEHVKAKIYFTPTHFGLRKLVVDFNSNKLCHVKGYRNVIIGK
uniref:protein-glutamine gamma-glutamyltransferase n=1 Tax=Myripristis murdjan TaxID=586833 RepID=A0A667XMM7_9TELE